MLQKTGEFDLHEPEHGRAGCRKTRFFDVVIEELLVDDICHNLSGKGNFKNLIKTYAQKSIENVLNLFLILELPEKRRVGEGNVVFELRQLFHGISEADYYVIRTGPDAFAAIDTPFLHDDRFPVIDTHGFHRAPPDTIRAPLAFLSIDGYRTEVLSHIYPLVDTLFIREIDFRVQLGPFTDFGINGELIGTLFDVKKPHARPKAHFPYFI